MSIIAETIKIQIDGETFDDYDFSDIQLVQELQKPIEFRFQMFKKNLIEDEKAIRFSLSEELIGKKVELFLSTIRDNEDGKAENDKLEFSGIVFNVNILREEPGANVLIDVTAYSSDYLLMDSPHCYSYEEEKLKNIVSKIVEPHDAISIKNNPAMGEDIPYTVQYNETHYAFMSRLAYRYGEWLYHNGKELVFGKIKKLDSLDLNLGRDVLSYHYHLNMEHPNFIHAHHNYLEYGNNQKKGVDFSNPSLHNLTDIAYDQSKSLYAKETFQHLKGSTAEGGFDETEFSAQVQGLGKKAQMMICQGRSNRADLQIGSVIKIKESYQKENGNDASCSHDELLIYKIIHKSDNSGFYETEFWAIPSACEYPPYNYYLHYPKAEPQRAVVMDNKDPEKLGRIRVQFLWQKEQDESLMTPWIRIAQPHGGENKGFYFIPEIEEEVMVGFENGNAEKPYVIGTLWHGEQKLDEEWYSDDNDIKVIRTRRHTIAFTDKGDKGLLTIYDHEEGTNGIQLNIEDKTITISSKGDIKILAENDIMMHAKNDISMKADNDIVMNAGGDIYREAGSNINDLANNNFFLTADSDMHAKAESNYFMESGGEMDIDAGGNMTTNVSGKSVTKATSDLNAKGMNVKIEADVNADLKAGAAVTVKGSATGEFNGGGMTSVKGGAIQIG